MKVIIAGSRDITNYDYVLQAIDLAGFSISEIVSGCARGVDTLGEMYALENNLPCKMFPADWARFGKRAGYLRNEQMAEYADALIAITNGSKGTQHMINIASKRNMKVFVFEVPKQ